VIEPRRPVLSPVSLITGASPKKFDRLAGRGKRSIDPIREPMANDVTAAAPGIV